MVGEIPGEAEATFAQLLAVPLRSEQELRDAVSRHLSRFEEAFNQHEFLDLAGAEHLAEVSEALLQRWPRLSEPEKRLSQAAILYFVESEEADDDFRIGGLRTDKQVLAAVTLALGRSIEAR